MSVFAGVAAQGQSIWFDYIQRSMLLDGTLHRLVRDGGVTGVTSNPAIFNKAIGGSRDYDPALAAAVRRGGSAQAVFESLAIQDIQLACDVLRPVWDATGGADGYVSLEVSPALAWDTAGTVADAERLWEAVARPNVMIKIPATPEGVPAIERVIGLGINVNVTLLFSVAAYEAVAEAHMAGLERWIARGGAASRVAGVASFFVSRIDSAVDARLDALAAERPDEAEALRGLRGRAAIANAKRAYAAFGRLTGTARWKALAEQGARPQRLLWASTGTKDPRYSDVLYVEQLIGPETVNTVPEATYHAFADHGRVAPTLTAGRDEAEATLSELASRGVSLDAVTELLLEQGVTAFADAFDTLLGTVERRRREQLGDGIPAMACSAGPASATIDTRLETMRRTGFVRRLWGKDAQLFGSEHASDPAVSGYMAWLDVARRTAAQLPALEALADRARADDVDDVVLMGMGGSSLAPEVFVRTWGLAPGSARLRVLDSTVPAQVKALADAIDPKRSLFVVASKSGTTTEPLAFDSFFYDLVRDGRRFYAVTDPGSKLERLARERRFAGIFAGEPEVGGRYSALSAFGMVAAAAIGADVADLLERATRMMESCDASVPPAHNPGVQLGAFLGELARGGRDKLTIVTTSGLVALGAWLEQLVAESTGKRGRGIVPVDGEALGGPELYGDDRVFAAFRLAGDDAGPLDAKLAALEAAGHPVVRFDLAHPHDIVQEMYRWEIATATAGHVLGINPFDQPNVQESKDYTKAFLTHHAEHGALPEVPGERVVLETEGLVAFTDAANAKDLEGQATLSALLAAHLGRVQAGDYVALNAYVDMNEAHDARLARLRHAIRDRHHVATTVGFGPRFLHSTGQIHKGGPSSGVFLIVTAEPGLALPVPGEAFDFGTLVAAQANGDVAALSKRGRRLLRIHLKGEVAAGLDALLAAL